MANPEAQETPNKLPDVIKGYVPTGVPRQTSATTRGVWHSATLNLLRERKESSRWFEQNRKVSSRISKELRPNHTLQRTGGTVVMPTLVVHTRLAGGFAARR